jgi:hypothetical protein
MLMASDFAKINIGRPRFNENKVFLSLVDSMHVFKVEIREKSTMDVMT